VAIMSENFIGLRSKFFDIIVLLQNNDFFIAVPSQVYPMGHTLSLLSPKPLAYDNAIERVSV